MPWTSPHSVFLSPETPASALPGNIVEMQILCRTPQPLTQKCSGVGLGHLVTSLPCGSDARSSQRTSWSLEFMGPFLTPDQHISPSGPPTYLASFITAPSLFPSYPVRISSYIFVSVILKYCLFSQLDHKLVVAKAILILFTYISSTM